MNDDAICELIPVIEHVVVLLRGRKALLPEEYAEMVRRVDAAKEIARCRC